MDARNRLWWVMGGVALLLVVVLTGGLYWLRPVDSVARADLARPRPTRDAQPFEFVATPGVPVSAERSEGDPRPDAPAADMAPASTLASAAPTGATGPGAAATQQLASPQPKPRVTLDTQEPATPAAAPAVRAIATTSARPRTAAAPATPAPAVAAKPAAEKRSEPLAKLAPTAPLHEFWVQVGSFASRARATALGQRLSDHGIVSRVTTRSTDADVFFRVRVGPYGSRAEAEKFLAWVQRVDGLDGSYVSEVRNPGG